MPSSRSINLYNIISRLVNWSLQLKRTSCDVPQHSLYFAQYWEAPYEITNRGSPYCRRALFFLKKTWQKEFQVKTYSPPHFPYFCSIISSDVGVSGFKKVDRDKDGIAKAKDGLIKLPEMFFPDAKCLNRMWCPSAVVILTKRFFKKRKNSVTGFGKAFCG